MLITSCMALFCYELIFITNYLSVGTKDTLGLVLIQGLKFTLFSSISYKRSNTTFRLSIPVVVVLFTQLSWTTSAMRFSICSFRLLSLYWGLCGIVIKCSSSPCQVIESWTPEPSGSGYSQLFSHFFLQNTQFCQHILLILHCSHQCLLLLHFFRHVSSATSALRLTICSFRTLALSWYLCNAPLDGQPLCGVSLRQILVSISALKFPLRIFWFFHRSSMSAFTWTNSAAKFSFHSLKPSFFSSSFLM